MQLHANIIIRIDWLILLEKQKFPNNRTSIRFLWQQNSERKIDEKANMDSKAICTRKNGLLRLGKGKIHSCKTSTSVGIET